MSAPKLFSPGPVMVKENVRQALTHYDICHRGAEFEELFARTTAKINKLFKADDSYRSVIVSGSGTSSNETVLSSIFNEGEKVMLIRNGEFGGRLLEIIEKYEIPLVDCEFPWGERPATSGKVEEMMAADPAIKVVAMVCHENFHRNDKILSRKWATWQINMANGTSWTAYRSEPANSSISSISI